MIPRKICILSRADPQDIDIGSIEQKFVNKLFGEYVFIKSLVPAVRG